MDLATGQINIVKFKENMIDTSSLSDEQKLAAKDTLLSCMASEYSRQNAKNETANMDGRGKTK